jgi:palmitoyl transferase
MCTSATALFCRAATLLLLTLPAASSWADDNAAAASAAPEGDTFTRSLKLDEDAPKSSYWDVYLSGYAYHDRDTYSKAQLRKMNELTWGGGLGRSFRNERGNEEGVYLMGIRDSNNRPQWMAGYQYKWMFPLKSHAGVEVGAGLTALVIRRHDWYDGRPFPAVLPIASIGNRAAQLVATYVPHLSARKKKGNILSLMLKISM